MNRYANFGIEEERMGDGRSSMQRWIPTVLQESSQGLREVDLKTMHFTDRKVFLSGEVTDEMAVDFTTEMLWLAKENRPIDVYVNTPGGSVTAGLVIYDVIQSLEGKVPINMYCIGMAASMGAVILAGGQKGRRFILPHSSCMIHEPLIPGGVGGSASSIKKTSESILETKSIIVEILAKHTGKSRKEIDKAISFDNYMNAEEAVKFGICDEIRMAV